MNKPTEAQIKEFWKGYGWEYAPGLGLISPEGEDFVPPIDLISLFRHAVPKARAGGITKIVFLYFEDSVWCQLFGSFQAEKEIACGKAETEEDALFWALQRVKELIGNQKY